ncbi:2-polyprenyl-6-methoxyphenol hydroxylase-like FAD-dependent oxidoreductase [Mycobacterium frederiksbergense]|uniref:2-polyprenyl-6-methoxyphenol hydroxylase-like FAD-dependent oxidoreductase n=1 Tax=Mycolicibacterium frederiksbergense TaxID=117567 RepID=A0ABT6L3Y2_9MYCO|nr:FAD-dependent monooxygenase [Mycolicibacterium frederiksbergense]MDH6197682.1 2-polyprenyl-6-methoxyphenol hydroxylase-like FAD-dependent oxidoreductase [Mycolicibacterium frederiksbergense]
MRVLISGGGIAGLTLAYWLHHHGHDPVVVERAPRGQFGGYGIDFFGTGYDIAARMGLTDRLAAHQLPTEDIRYIDKRGRPRARLERRLLEKVIGGPYLALMHARLEEALADAVGNRVEVRHENRIAAVEQRPDGIDVVFADGTQEGFDLLVGADGVHSATRELVFGPEEQFARHLGYAMACYPVPDTHNLGPRRIHYSEPGRQIVLYPTDTPGELIALFLHHTAERDIPRRSERRATLHDAFDGMGWITPDLLAAAPEDDLFMDNLTQIRIPTWHRGRVALIGDACAAMTLTSAQGASMAMAGGYLLAEALNQHADHTTAFRAYDARLRPAVRLRQDRARAFARTLVPRTRTGLVIQGALSCIVMREAFAGLLRRGYGDTTSIFACT